MLCRYAVVSRMASKAVGIIQRREQRGQDTLNRAFFPSLKPKGQKQIRCMRFVARSISCGTFIGEVCDSALRSRGSSELVFRFSSFLSLRCGLDE